VATNQNNNSELEELARKYLNGSITPDEQARFENWYANFNDEELELKNNRFKSVDELKSSIYRKIEYRIHGKRKASGIWIKTAVAALILVVLAIGFYFYKSENRVSNSKYVVKHEAKDFGPGRNSASLLLENGKEINLDKLKDGEKIETKEALFQKSKDGELILVMLNQIESSITKHSEITYNTIITPRGGNYKIILSDGTKVWLNSSSSLRFPTTFNGTERKVELTGEAYFDVTKDKNNSFKVTSKGQEVSVLGTEFNVSAYPDEENIKTTLVEGSVKVSYKTNSKIIKPGEQSIVHDNGEFDIRNVDVMNVKAWKEGYFAFDKLSIKEVMNQISRWYDVKVSYQGEITRKQLIGQISKQENLSTIIKMLEFNGMNLDFENNSIVVKK